MNAHSTKQKEGSNESIGRQKTQYLKVIKNKFEKDKTVKLRVRNDSKKQPVRIVEGTVIQINNFLIAVKTSTRVESFQFSEFLAGRIKIIA